MPAGKSYFSHARSAKPLPLPAVNDFFPRLVVVGHLNVEVALPLSGLIPNDLHPLDFLRRTEIIANPIALAVTRPKRVKTAVVAFRAGRALEGIADFTALNCNVAFFFFPRAGRIGCYPGLTSTILPYSCQSTFA